MTQIKVTIEPRATNKKHETFERQNANPKDVLMRRRCQIFTEVEFVNIELDPVDLDDGWFAAFLGRLARIVRNIGVKR